MRAFCIIIACSGLLIAGCKSLTPDQSRERATQRWDEMRGRVKLQLARQQADSGRFEDTVRSATEAMTLDPTKPDAYVLLAQAHLELGHIASAQEAIDAAWKHCGEGADDATSAALHYTQGVISELRDAPKRARAEYARAHELTPDRLDYLIALAECDIADGRTEEALQLLEERGQRVDDDGSVAALTAEVCLMLGKRERAVQLFRKAHAEQPTDPLTTSKLGRLLIQAHRYREGLALLIPLLASNGEPVEDGSVRKLVATAALAVGDAQSARSAIDGYALAHADDALAQLLLAKAALATGDIVTALRCVTLAAERDPNRPELWLVRAAVQFKRGRYQSAASDLYNVLQNNPQDIEAMCLLAEVLRAQKRSDAARTYFHRALEVDSECAWAHAGLRALRDLDHKGSSEPSPRLTSATASTGD